MKINEIIRTKRKEKNMTQEDLAQSLGISTPAVNKWEKGSTYPDITLLPALAKVLGTDLNTLLSFEEKLTDSDISEFSKELNRTFELNGYEEAFDLGMEKVHAHPEDGLLGYSVSAFLLSALQAIEIKNKDKYVKKIDRLINRLIKINDSLTKPHLKAVVIGKYIENEKYDEAEKIINSLPDSSLSKEYLLGELYSCKGEHKKASEFLESKLLMNIFESQSILMKMIESNDDIEIVEKYVDADNSVMEIFDLNHNVFSQASLELSIRKKDVESCINLLAELISSKDSIWQINKSIFFRHINDNTINSNNKIYIKTILNNLMTREDTEFLRNDERFRDIVKNNNPSPPIL